MMIKVLLISLIYNMSIGLWSPPVGDKFDKELFDRNQKDGFYEYHHDDYTVVLSDLGNMYKRVIYPDSSAFEYGTTYYKKELTVMGTATTLYGMFIGEIRSYDIQGKLTEIRDMDAPYKYTIEDVVKFIKDKYDVDLLKREKGSWTLISRSPTPTLHYMLRFLTKEGLPVVYSIDGIDGTIIWENVNGKETIIRDYFEKKLKEQKEKKQK